ncbi:DUF5333 domain-containing protein [Pseudooctadecabacter jejudonensis]|uniref:Uncharacterized protein n=1 Tax=Pseudooctadecabacter jejudonensis TaxID=1391910 RepID=A0A1Y5T927_9RHOB|nr:DUF5333 domain-containing protein [Pseudooctadecabacter jejudonensis]SLN58401.1 hypothetical protein PSJ8397_03072 [Pseudooctadecabacter jejudonensis]
MIFSVPAHAAQTLRGVALGLVVLASPVQAQSFPGDVERVTEGLIAAGMAIELGDKCDDVSVRYLRGINFLQSLKRALQDEGFSNAEIDAYIDNDEEKDRLEAIARGRLADLGVIEGNEASHCTVANAQIAQDTQVGRLLR